MTAHSATNTERRPDPKVLATFISRANAEAEINPSVELELWDISPQSPPQPNFSYFF